MKRLLLAVPLLTSGCVSVTPQVTSTSYNPETMEILGPARGESSSAYLLGFIPLDDPASTEAALAEALASTKADLLLNASVDNERGFVYPLFPLYHWQTIRVAGTAARFKRPPLPGTARP